MKKHWSIALNLLLTIMLLFFLYPAEEAPTVDLTEFTQSKIQNSIHIELDMPTPKIIEIMGPPVIKEIKSGMEILHYCRTGREFDEYVSIETVDDKVKSMSYLVADINDVAFSYTPAPSLDFLEIIKPWDCKHGLKWKMLPQGGPKPSDVNR